MSDSVCKNIGGKKAYISKPGGEISRIRADIKKSEKILGYKPEKDILSMLPELIAWWIKQRG